MTNCNLCGLQNGFVKSHVIPQAFFLGESEPTQRKLIEDGQYPKKAPIGVYDAALLCDGCERRFTLLDDYGVQILIKRKSEFFETIKEGNVVAAIESVPGVIDQDLLLRFFVSVLWRASRSTNPYFKRVILGPHESVAAESMFSIGPVDDRFGVVLSCWKNVEEMNIDLKDVNMDPFDERWNGVNAYRFYFGEIVAYIKADQRPFPRNLAKFALGANPRIRMVARDFARSSDLKAMQETLRRGKVPSGKTGVFW